MTSKIFQLQKSMNYSGNKQLKSLFRHRVHHRMLIISEAKKTNEEEKMKEEEKALNKIIFDFSY